MDATVASWLRRLRVTGAGRRGRRAEVAAGKAELDGLCGKLENELGPFGYQWLCACAVYPGLRLPITSYLGAELARAVNRPVPDEAEHMALARLPWFRVGWMPDELRLRLFRDLEPQFRTLVREAIERLIHDAAEGSDRPQPAEPAEIARPPAGWSRGFHGWLKTSAGEAAGENLIFVRYMLGGVPRAADLELSRRLTRLFGARLAGWLDRWTLLGIGTAILILLLVALQAGSLLRPWFDVIREHGGIAETFRECEQCPELVLVPAGRFMMGSSLAERQRYDDAGPRHEVSVAAFALGRTEVTFEEWDACVADGGCNKYAPGDEGWGRGRRPVINVSWNDAQAYASWLSKKTERSYRLPSEAEWEYAARGGTQTAYPWGEDWDARLANGADSFGRTSDAASYPANPTGFYDMIGNVWEWVEDCWHDDYTGAPADGKAWVDAGGCKSPNEVRGGVWRAGPGRVLRGGSWNVGPGRLRSAVRDWGAPGNRGYILGFRVSRTLTPGSSTILPRGGSGGATPGGENLPPRQQQTTPPDTGQPTKGK
jgi:formylglycine-generating enzyme required for sulfatase activity